MKICLATTEILGAHRNGGIGTATSHLALLLAHRGHEVTLLNASSEKLEQIGSWSSLYRRFGIQIIRLPADELDLEPWWLRAPTAYFDHLWVCDFDVVIFQDWLGLAHACTSAKTAGLAFENTLLVVNTHGPMEWVHDVARVSPPSRGKLLQVEIERRAVEQADAVVSPSQYLVDWMRARGWRLPHATVVMQNFLDGLSLAGLKTSRTPWRPPNDHLVYFGRLERRKGIFLFLDALCAAPLAERQFLLSFLGRDADLNGPALQAWVLENRPDLAPGLQIHTQKTAEEAMAYLRDSRGVAVIPSYSDNLPCVIWECIEERTPFISTLNGGIPELVDPKARDRVLVEPEPGALSCRLAEALDGQPWPEVAHMQVPAAVGRAWLSWLEGLRAAEPRMATAPRAPASRITVVLIGAGDEIALERRLRELTLQTSADFDLVVVSDGERPVTHGATLSPAWIALPRGGLSAVLKSGAAKSDSSHLIFATTAGQLSPALVHTLNTSRHAFPDSVITAGSVEADSDDESGDLFMRPPVRRRGFVGGPAAVGAFENCFGDFPFVIQRSSLIEDASWLPQNAETGWSFLAAWTLRGGHVLSLPVSLSARPAEGDSVSEREARQREQTNVRRLYAAALPPALADIVLCDQD